MRHLSNKDYLIFEQLVSLTQAEMASTMSGVLKAHYKQVHVDPKFIFAKGDIPIALVAHMDTVFSSPVENLYYDPRRNVMWSSEGLGADDRAGIFAILYILLHTKFRPHIILTTDEEKGCLGADALAKYKCPFDNLKYLIQLDRRGANDCVFYDCYCPQFVEYVESFGFVENYGTFSDISSLCPAWNVCGVNLSIGYENEHSIREILHVGQMLSTIDKVIKMLQEQDIPNFTYTKLARNHFQCLNDIESKENVVCSGCGIVIPEYETFPVKCSDNTTRYYCLDCIDPHVEWCDVCQEAYEVNDKNRNTHMCDECLEKYVHGNH